jgi:hypothetical protein
MRALTLTVYLGSDHIHPGVALIGKVSSVVDSVRGGAVEEDASLIGDLVTHGVVDKVVNSSPKTNGMRVKIRLREANRPSAINFPVVTARKVLSVAWSSIRHPIPPRRLRPDFNHVTHCPPG